MRRKSRFSRYFSLLALAAVTPSARAQSASTANLDATEPALGTLSAKPAADEAITHEKEGGTSAARAADEGFFLPLTQAPQIHSGHALLTAMAGYDTARENLVGRTSVDATLLPILAVRVDFEHGKGMGP